MMDMEIVEEGFFVITIAIIRIHQYKYLQQTSHHQQQKQQVSGQQHQLSEQQQQQHINRHHHLNTTAANQNDSTSSLDNYDVIFYCTYFCKKSSM